MYELRQGRFFKLAVCLVLLVTITLSAGIYSSVQAAAKPSIEAKMTIGTGSLVGNYDYYSVEDGKYDLLVSDAVKGATYTFTSSNSKIVSVKVSGTKAFLTGLKAGTATITVNQKLKGKTTKVGTCTVTVKNATVHQDSIPVLPLGTSNGNEPLEFSYRNNDATYTYVSNSKNFTMKENIKKFDGMNFISHSFTAKEPGTYTVTVKETYNKSTRTVGTIKYTVKKATVEAESKIDLGDSTWVFDLINDYRTDVYYFILPEDNGVVETSVNGDSLYLKGKKAGTANVKVYENAQSADESKLLGTCKVTVKEVVLEDLALDFDETEVYVYDDPIEFSVDKEPSNALGEITVTSSNPDVATVSGLDEEGIGTITPVSVGTTEIKITCGSITKTQTITVLDDEDEDDDEDDEDY